MSESDKEQLDYQANRQAIEEAYRTGVIKDKSIYEQQITELENMHAAERKRIAEDEAETKRRLAAQEMQDRLNAAHDFFGNMATLMQSGSKKAFEVGKVAAIANATVSMWESAAHSFNFGSKIGGPVLGGAMAAAAVAAGLVRIQNIAKTQFGGGGGGGSSGSGSGISGVGQQPDNGAPPPRQTNVNISLQGSSFSQDQVRGLISSIGEAMGDNVRLGVA